MDGGEKNGDATVTRRKRNSRGTGRDDAAIASDWWMVGRDGVWVMDERIREAMLMLDERKESRGVNGDR